MLWDCWGSDQSTGRDSSPVIGQRFNPEVFFRWWLQGDDYVGVGYSHESNGQSINSQSSFVDKQENLRQEGDDERLAKEYLSRGWDYWELTWLIIIAG